MNGPRARLPLLLLAAAGVAGACWTWRCYCVFPWLLWNELRLEPSFLLASGLPLYPVADGPVTTWIYGPLTPLLLFPATFAHDAAGALLTAAGLNLIIVLGPLALACVAWPAPGLSWRVRAAVAAGCLAVWPASSLQYIQADNAAVAFGWIANLLLLHSAPHQRGRRWLAALAVAAAVGCKQIAGGVLLAQLLWLARREGWRPMLGHAARTATCIAAGVAVVIAVFGTAGARLNLIEIPSRLPWTDAPVKRLVELAPHLLVHVALPAAALFAWRARLREPGSPLALAALSWLAALPLGLAAMLKIGGTINSLHGLLYVLPPLLLTACERRHSAATRLPLAFAATALAVFVLRLQLSPAPAWRPLTAQLREADALAAQLPGEVWFPWNPLVTYYREHRLDHVEDGLYVRRLVGLPLDAAQVRRHLPPHWNVVALLRRSAHWGLAVDLAPAGRQVSEFGHWTLYSWAADAPPPPPPPPAVPGL